MLKKTITYENPFTDEKVTEDHYFHISKADLVEMEMEEHGTTYVKGGVTLTGMQAKVTRIQDSEDGKAIIEELKDIIRRSYGKKDGDRFLKSPEIWGEFSSSEAFSQLFYDLCTDAEQASEFINGVVPSNIDEIADEITQRAEKLKLAQTAGELAGVPTPVGDPTGLTNPVTPQVLTTQQAAEMDATELQAGLAAGRYKLS